ncbi:type IV pilus secretin PilQ [Thiopseudomonas alkaliphila]|uniref:type IV pilus secretin PilQ n=1 Tax=Thiopseudomonas alkaliphila TaxID=1697053 RepID=UPI00069F1E17|nr:type IV pilus secretin PilQ family protein [Thiopseudomonas alkaliphila]
MVANFFQRFIMLLVIILFDAMLALQLAASELTTYSKLVSNTQVENLYFKRGGQGEGNVILTLTEPDVRFEVKEESDKIHLVLLNTSLSKQINTHLKTKEFATPVQLISMSQSGKDVSVIIELIDSYKYAVHQVGRQITVSVNVLPYKALEEHHSKNIRYVGEKISLNFQDVNLRAVLQVIADFTQLNLVVNDTVQGNITLQLQNVPWDQALDVILKTKGLAQRKEGNVLLIAPSEELAARERQELEIQRQAEELAPLRRELIQINYAKATDIAALFRLASGEQTEERGIITVDERTNAIIAYQTQERLAELSKIVSQLDTPVRQVMIEARIVEASVDYEKELGVRWGGERRGSSTHYNINNAFVDLGANNASSGVGIGFLSGKTRLDLELSAMEKTGNGEVVSQPKIITSDKETAKIMKGSEVPYQEASSSGATSTSFKQAALSLEVTPYITPDNRILMEVRVTKDAPDFQKAINGVPPIDKNELSAKVLVVDGETIVIGGVFQKVQKESLEKVPVLGDIPGLKGLFRRKMRRDDKTELLVFITPRIMNNQSISLNR